ncbi:MAG: methyltransferase [Pseudomonadota bacterium]
MTAFRPFSARSRLLSALAGALLLSACGGETADPSGTGETAARAPDGQSAPAAAPRPAEASAATLDAVIAGPQRGDGHAARDQYRHPKETLSFFGLEPDMTVVEMSPGGGWYTRIIAPYLASGNGQYIALQPNPGDNQRRIDRLEAFKNTFSGTETFGTVSVALLGAGGSDIEPGSADMVLTFRNVHNWMGGQTTDAVFASFYDALKPGGVLGVVEHRGDPDKEQDPRGRTGYVREDVVIAMAQKAGFVVDATSEINANPKDDRDHPFGVWTLKPVRRSSQTGAPDPEFDRAGYDAIGESDRMTIRFRKPLDDDGALLE